MIPDIQLFNRINLVCPKMGCLVDAELLGLPFQELALICLLGSHISAPTLIAKHLVIVTSTATFKFRANDKRQSHYNQVISAEEPHKCALPIPLSVKLLAIVASATPK